MRMARIAANITAHRVPHTKLARLFSIADSAAGEISIALNMLRRYRMIAWDHGVHTCCGRPQYGLRAHAQNLGVLAAAARCHARKVC